MPTTGGYTDPIIFVEISFIINFLLSALFRSSMLTLLGMHDSRSSFSILSTVIIEPIEVMVGLLFLGMIFNLVYHLKAIGGTGNHESTVRFISYASAPTVLTWIPILGLIFAVYHYYLYIVGGMIVQKVSMKKSAIAILPFATLYLYLGVQSILSGFAH